MKRDACYALLLVACHADAEPAVRDHRPTVEVVPIARDALCVTHGTIQGTRISDPTVRAIAPLTSGTAGRLAFDALGRTTIERDLASGQARHQVGLKLRAQDSCNVLYVMWRSDKPRLEVSLKLNAGSRTHAQCGAAGYTKLRGTTRPIPALTGAHELRGEVVGNELTAWVDGQVAWRGTLPAEALALTGPSGFRTDNIEVELAAFSAPLVAGAHAPCGREATTD